MEHGVEGWNGLIMVVVVVAVVVAVAVVVCLPSHPPLHSAFLKVGVSKGSPLDHTLDWSAR